MKAITLMIGALGGALLLGPTLIGEESGVDWKTLDSAKVDLAKGFAAAQAKGGPISGKFEMEEGKLQLSVYTASKGKFWEVIVDHTSGRVSKTEEIKEGDDLAAAKAQSKTMAKARISLREATEKAVVANAGYRAVSAVPEVKDSKPVASVVLENGSGTRTVSESLD